jgi:WD domain, G-beta repeat
LNVSVTLTHGLGAEQAKIDQDPTNLSLIDAEYEACVRFLLSCTDVSALPSIDNATLKSFKAIYGDALLFCRYTECTQAVAGFVSSSAREQHEIQHMRRLQCDVTHCAWKGAGFKKLRDLKAHKQNYHPTLDDFVVPKLVTAGEPKPVDTAAKAPDANDEVEYVEYKFKALAFADLPTDKKVKGPDWCALYNPEGPRLFSVSAKNTIKHTSVITSVCFSKDLKWVAMGSNRVTQIYHTADASLFWRIDHTSGDGDCYVRGLCFFPDGSHLVSADDDSTVKVCLSALCFATSFGFPLLT